MAESHKNSRQSSKEFHPSAIVNPKGHLAGDKVGFQDVVAFLKESGNRAGSAEIDNAAVSAAEVDNSGKLTDIAQVGLLENSQAVNNAD
jgi:hypothetical protein